MASSLLSYGKVALTTALTSALAIGGVTILDAADSSSDPSPQMHHAEHRMAAAPQQRAVARETAPEGEPVRIVITQKTPQAVLKALTAGHDTSAFAAAVAPVMFETSLSAPDAPTETVGSFTEAAYAPAPELDTSSWSEVSSVSHLVAMDSMAAPKSTLAVPASLSRIETASLATNDREAPKPLEQGELEHLTLDIEAVEAALEEFEAAADAEAPDAQ